MGRTATLRTSIVVLAMALAITLAITTPALAQNDFKVTNNGVLWVGGDVSFGKCSSLQLDMFLSKSDQEKAVRVCKKAGFPVKGSPTQDKVEPQTPLSKTGGPPLILVPIALLIVGGLLIRKSTAQ